MAAFHAKPGRPRDSGGSESRRDAKDRYETPDDVIDALTAAFGPELSRATRIVDPCCGTGRVVRRLRRAYRSAGTTVDGTDLEEDGVDFLSPTQRIYREGDLGGAACVTNPPFSHASDFVVRALELFGGPVAMLLPADFMWSGARRDWLAGEGRPAGQLIVPWRIKFIQRDGRPIRGQAYSHQWLVWPPRDLRPATSTVTGWAELSPARKSRARKLGRTRQATVDDFDRAMQ
jgi:hypothetical protein